MAMRRTLTEETTSQLLGLEDKCKGRNSSTVDLCFPVWWLSAIGGIAHLKSALEMCCIKYTRVSKTGKRKEIENISIFLCLLHC